MKFDDDFENQETVLKLLESEKSKSKNESSSVSKTPLFFSKRLLVTVSLFFSFVNFQVLRNNMNIAVVEMTSNKLIIQGNTTLQQAPEFEWDSLTIGLVTSVINYGGLLSFLNGFLINKLGSSTSCALSMFLAGVATVLHPIFLWQSFYALLACRFLTGIFEAGFYASTSQIFSRWFPVKERSTLIAFSYNGTNGGVAMVFPFCGYLAHTWGWPMVFYVTGAESIIMAVVFLILVKNHPKQDKYISKSELAYILEGNTDPASGDDKNHYEKKKKNSDVFKPILTSVPILSFFFLIFTYMWIATMLTACLPLYVKDLTGKESDEVGYISSIPNIVFIFMFPVTGAIIDFWKNHSDTTTTKIHKILVSAAYITGVVFFVAVTFVSDLTTSLSFFVLIQTCMSFVPLIISVMTISLTPNHISHLASISSEFFFLGAIGVQTMTGFITKNHSLHEWNTCFLLTAAVAVLGNVVIVIFGSSDPQPWSLSPTAKDDRT